MAKQADDKATAELFEVKRGRGRPCTGNAMTDAQRQARYREKKRIESRRAKLENEKSAGMWEDYTNEDLCYAMANAHISDETRESLWRAYGKRMGWL